MAAGISIFLPIAANGHYASFWAANIFEIYQSHRMSNPERMDYELLTEHLTSNITFTWGPAWHLSPSAGYLSSAATVFLVVMVTAQKAPTGTPVGSYGLKEVVETM